MTRAALTLARAALAQIIPTLPGYREQHAQAMAAIDAALAHPCPDPGACEAAQICQAAAERLTAHAPVAMCHGCDMPQCRDAGRCAWVAPAAPAPVVPPAGEPVAWSDARLRGIASNYFPDAKDWPAAMLCLRHLLMEQSKASPAAARVPMTPAQQHADELLAALRGLEAMAERYRPPGYPTPDAQKYAIAVIAKVEAAGQEGGAA